MMMSLDADSEVRKEGYVTDCISGEAVRATPEEVQAVQPFAKALLHDYGYPVNLIQTHPQWRVRKRPSDSAGTLPVDIAVFSAEPKSDSTLHIVVECKQKTRKDGLRELEDYLRLSAARIGVWFNGDEREFIKKVESQGTVTFESLPNIPRFGERLEDVGQYLRGDLRKAHNLKAVFRAIRNRLAGSNVGTTRDEELARQLINIMFCKIYDERFTAPDRLVSFRAGVDEDDSEIAARIRSIFEKVKAKYEEVIDRSEALHLDDRSLAYVVGELQPYSITEMERDAIADTFETFVGGALKGEQGQFFTPRNVVRLLVSLVDPKPGQMIIDPACGSGGFLVEAMRHVWTHIEAEGDRLGWSELAVHDEKTASAIKCIRGIEKDQFLSRVAKA